MALENVVEVHDGKVIGAFTSQAKNVSYGNGSVEDALDEIYDNMTDNIGSPEVIKLPYTTTCSGFISMAMSPSTSAGGYSICNADNVNHIASSSNGSTAEVVFPIRKGASVAQGTSSNSSTVYRFIPFR